MPILAFESKKERKENSRSKVGRKKKEEERKFPIKGWKKEVIIFSCCSVIFNKCAVKAFVSKIQKNYRNSHDHDKEGTTRGPKREFSLIHKVIEDSVNNGSI